MPWRTTDVDEQRMQFVIRATSGTERLSALCREFGISRPTGYVWRRRYQQSRTLTQISERSRRPHHSPTRTGPGQEQRVVALRKQTGWGAKKLRVLLREEEIPLPVRTIHRILERNGLVSEQAHGPALGRFQRGEPNQLWQMDSKGKYPLQDGECVERFHRTLGAELRHRGVPPRFAQWPAALVEVETRYNEQRPHEALGMLRPVERYRPSPQKYAEQVKPWEYAVGSDVRRLNSQGMLTEQGERWFICGALAEQRVRVERFDGKLLVSYRHMYIREVDLERRCSRALVVERGRGAEDAPVALRAPSASSAPETPQEPKEEV
jgi:transposase-like protein